MITWLSGDEGIVNSANHGELSFDTCENFSDSEFSSEDVHKEVEFTLALVSTRSENPMKRREKPPLMVSFCSRRKKARREPSG